MKNDVTDKILHFNETCERAAIDLSDRHRHGLKEGCRIIQPGYNFIYLEFGFLLSQAVRKI